jgi:hypothetical protein
VSVVSPSIQAREGYVDSARRPLLNEVLEHGTAFVAGREGAVELHFDGYTATEWRQCPLVRGRVFLSVRLVRRPVVPTRDGK